MTKKRTVPSGADEVVLPASTPPKWTQDEAIAFGCARDYIGDLMVLYMTLLDDMQSKPDAPVERVAWLQSEIRRLKTQRRSLKVSDHDEIAEIRRVYGALLKGSRGVW
jgi:hypothetical protein